MSEYGTDPSGFASGMAIAPGWPTAIIKGFPLRKAMYDMGMPESYAARSHAWSAREKSVIAKVAARFWGMRSTHRI